MKNLFILILTSFIFITSKAQDQISDSTFINKIQNKNWVWADSKTGFVIDFVLTPDTMVFLAIHVVFGTPDPNLCTYKKEYIGNIIYITPLNCKPAQEEKIYTYVYLKNDNTLMYNGSENKLLKKEEILKLEEWVEFETK